MDEVGWVSSWLIMETLVAVGGYGLKTAVEVTVMATGAGAIPPFEEVLAGRDTKSPSAIEKGSIQQ